MRLYGVIDSTTGNRPGAGAWPSFEGSVTTIDTPDPARILAVPGATAAQVEVRTFFGAEDATTHAPLDTATLAASQGD